MPRRTQTAASVSKLGFMATLISADRQNRKLLALFTAKPATVPVINHTTESETLFGWKRLFKIIKDMKGGFQFCLLWSQPLFGLYASFIS